MNLKKKVNFLMKPHFLRSLWPPSTPQCFFVCVKTVKLLAVFVFHPHGNGISSPRKSENAVAGLSHCYGVDSETGNVVKTNDFTVIDQKMKACNAVRARSSNWKSNSRRFWVRPGRAASRWENFVHGVVSKGMESS